MNLKPLGANQTQITVGLTDILFSYRTPVAIFDHNTGVAYKTDCRWSNTTTRHINKWFGERKNIVLKSQEFFDAWVK